MLRVRCARQPLVLVLRLVSLAQVQSGQAVVGLFWNSILSWDNPATHASEGIASLTPPFTDPARQAREQSVAAALSPTGHVIAPDGPDHPPGPVSAGPVSQAPPVV